MQHLPPSSIYPEQNVKANFPLWTASLKTTSLTFPSVTPQTVSSCLTYGCLLDLFTPPFFTLTASLCTSRCSPNLPFSSIPFRGKTRFLLLLFWLFMHGTAGQRASRVNTNTTVLIRDQHRLSNTVTQQNVPLWRKWQHSASRFTFWTAPDSWDWTLTWPTCHVWLVWTVCVYV